MKSIFADLHIHIGRTKKNQPVKITAAKNMLFEHILHESHHRKGLQMIGIIDAQSPPVQEEILEGIRCGRYKEHPDGGIIFKDLTCILGAEIELKEPGQGAFHALVYFPYLEQIIQFSQWLSKYMKNVQLSTQRLYQPVESLQDKVEEMNGIFIPAHVFTPFKSIYGKASNRMNHVVNMSRVCAIELGLSSDSFLADCIYELHPYSFVTNSDAHSIPKIGREYNQLLVEQASFKELKMAILRHDGRKVQGNYGLNPKLGKYYRTRCLECSQLWPQDEKVMECPSCYSRKQVKGVYDRISEIADQKTTHPNHRPPYVYQVPLEFIPKLGTKTLEKLLFAFGTEMNILHDAPFEEIEKITNTQIASYILSARMQKLELVEGGGGIYGKVRS